MDKTYTVDWCERKTTSTGKEKLDASLRDEAGVVSNKATIWSDFPGFNEIAPGGKVVGTLTPSKDERFGPTLYPARPQKAAGASFKAKVIEQAMDKKNEAIKGFQESKTDSIRLAGCQRDAVLLTQTMFGNNIWNDPVFSEDEKRTVLKKEVIKWRDWLYLSKEFNDLPPFE